VLQNWKKRKGDYGDGGCEVNGKDDEVYPVGPRSSGERWK